VKHHVREASSALPKLGTSGAGDVDLERAPIETLHDVPDVPRNTAADRLGDQEHPHRPADGA
jgi:hypothetical protein